MEERAVDPQQFDKHWTSFQAHERQVTAAAKQLHSLLQEDEARAIVDQFALAHAAMGDGYRKGLEAFKSSGFDPAAGDLAVKGMDRAPSELLNKSMQLIQKASKVSIARAAEASTQATVLSIVMMVAGIAGALFCGILISRSITGPLQQAVEVAKTVASGDLTAEIVVRTQDENGEMLQGLDDMNRSLASTVAQVRAATDAISTASSQIAAGNLDLSSRTEEQASALQQTASAMEEQTASIMRNADNAMQANRLAQSASDVATKGGEVVAKVITTMGSIDQSAKKIVDIISVIDGIAFQTNILALNAAVEAARAGEQGRGFAVVASEVRTLAQRSATAAKEIKSLIEVSVQNVDAGSLLVSEAGSTMEQVVGSIRQVTDIMTEITNATAEQSRGIEHVNQAISQMDQVTQQNAALVEQSAAAADAMKDQALKLAHVVGVFKLA